MALDLATAEKIVKAAVARAQEMGVPLAIAVVDEGGHLVHLTRMDGAPFLAPKIAMGKAYAAAAWRLPSGELEKRAQSAPAFYANIGSMTQGQVIVRQGALPIVVGGQVVGAAGASGGTSQEDEDAVRAGVEAVG